MVTATLYDVIRLEGSPVESPYTTSSDDLFADINWPEDEADSPSGKDQCPSGSSNSLSLFHENEFRKDYVNYPNASREGDDLAQELDAANAPQKSNGGCRFSKEVRSILRTWFNEHKDNPYPTTEEKKELASKTHLKSSQISLWLVNARRRHRSRKQGAARESIPSQTMLPPSLASTSFNSSQGAVGSSQLQRPFEELNPMDRWKVTPIEQEPAPPPVIAATVAAAAPLDFDPFKLPSRRSASRFESDLQSGACLSHYDSFWGRSMSSFETGLTSMASGSSISDSTAFSYPMLNMSYDSQEGWNATRDRRRRRCHTNKSVKPASKDRLFQCTFCADCTFATKHDWQRHEKSRHLTLESWTCCLSGGTIPSDNGPACVFCDQLNPDAQHMETHNYSECQEKGIEERTFYRKDHFQQHLRLTHNSKFHSGMAAWKAEILLIHSRCGFCSATFTTWSARTDHLAAHFKCRATMQDWAGDWGFEPHIAALVERATPKASQSHPKLAAPSIPPPLHPYVHLDNVWTEGVVDYEQPLQKQAFPTATIDGYYGAALSMSPLPADNAGFLGLENIDVTDCADFGI